MTKQIDVKFKAHCCLYYWYKLRGDGILYLPKGEVNSGGHILRREASRYNLALFTDPEEDSCFSIYQISWIKMEKK